MCHKFILQFPIILVEGTESKSLDDSVDSQTTSRGSMAATLTVKLKLNCAKGVHLNEEAPSSWRLSSEGIL